jgi:nicotinamidase-related amidase
LDEAFGFAIGVRGTTVRGGVEHNYRMVLVSDAVAEVSREAHDAELRTMDRLFADVRSTDEVVGLLHSC